MSPPAHIIILTERHLKQCLGRRILNVYKKLRAKDTSFEYWKMRSREVRTENLAYISESEVLQNEKKDQ